MEQDTVQFSTSAAEQLAGLITQEFNLPEGVVWECTPFNTVMSDEELFIYSGQARVSLALASDNPMNDWIYDLVRFVKDTGGIFFSYRFDHKVNYLELRQRLMTLSPAAQRGEPNAIRSINLTASQYIARFELLYV